MPDYLLEVRSQEISPAQQKRGLEQIARGLFEELMGRGLAPVEIVTVSTPRRLAVLYRGLPEREVERRELRFGPAAAEAWDAAGAATPQLVAFAAAQGVDPASVERRNTELGERAAVELVVPSETTREVLARHVPRLLEGIAWGGPKRDREPAVPEAVAGVDRAAERHGSTGWGGGRAGWVRPILSLVSLYDGAVLPVSPWGVEAGDRTAGHPILSPKPFRIRDLDDYLRRLRRLGIEPSYEKRRELLERQLRRAASAAGGELRDHDRLLRRVAGQCEIPGVVVGELAPGPLDLPLELVVAALTDGLGAFPLWREEVLLPSFLAVVDRPDDPVGAVRSGLETAAAGCLADLRFHYQEDLRVSLAERRRRLDQIDFAAGLGSYGEKVVRVRVLGGLLSEESGRGVDVGQVSEAIELMKADLTTATVREHRRLRGVLGGLQARHEGYVDAVWLALRQQYLPARPQDPIPQGEVAQVVALADRLDTLVGLAGSSRLPLPGGSDPEALRATADGLLRIVIEGDFAVDLDLVAARAVLLYDDRLGRSGEEILGDLQRFLGERLRFLLARRGYAFDEVEAAMAVGFSRLPELVARVAALHEARQEPSFTMLVHAAQRLSKIVDQLPELEVRPELLVEEAERELHAVYVELRPEIERLAVAGRYAECLRAMAGLVPNLDRFFSLVLVMDADDERRQNRIALLQAVRRVFWKVGRLRELVVEGRLA